jgi:hypothetical protein
MNEEISLNFGRDDRPVVSTVLLISLRSRSRPLSQSLRTLKSFHYFNKGRTWESPAPVYPSPVLSVFFDLPFRTTLFFIFHGNSDISKLFSDQIGSDPVLVISGLRSDPEYKFH